MTNKKNLSLKFMILLMHRNQSSKTKLTTSTASSYNETFTPISIQTKNINFKTSNGSQYENGGSDSEIEIVDPEEHPEMYDYESKRNKRHKRT